MTRFLIILISLLVSVTAMADSLESVMMPGKVIQGHVKWEDDCQQCHKRFDKAAQDKLCRDCHKEVNKDIVRKKGFHGKMQQGKMCKACHTEHKGRKANIVKLDKKKFNHKLTDFQLKGGHAKQAVLCKDCHKPDKKYREAPTACVACHKKDDEHKGGLGNKCASCHVDKDWKTIDFDHDESEFKLRGAHAKITVACQDCHKDNQFKETPKACYACHKKDDTHNGVFGRQCAECHTDVDWKKTTFDHTRDGRYKLLGKHRTAKCESCHRKAAQKLSRTCIACHRQDDVHKGTLGKQCGNCHNERSWGNTSEFNHNKDTDFPLRFKHKSAKCEACHTTGAKFKKLPLDCYSCHKKEDEHRGKFGQKCEECHNAKDWKEDIFDHSKTEFPLTGKHKPAKCESCHVNGLEEKLKTGCNDCHQEDDPHKAVFGTDCKTCHVDRDWKETDQFDHTRDTKYPLKGKHIKTKCEACHKPPPAKAKLSPTSTCYSCHQGDDIHKGTEGKNCEKCHTEATWKVDDFDHNETDFPLLGKHGPVECKECHLTGKFKEAKKDCYACHQKDDEHKKQLGTLCEDCHNARDWAIWDFNHDATDFVLDGGHVNVPCLDCHRVQFTGKVKQNTSCFSCHADDDVHGGSFGPRCERCHVNTDFREIKINAGVGR